MLVTHEFGLEDNPKKAAGEELHVHAENSLAIFGRLPSSVRTFELDLHIDIAWVMHCDPHRNMLQAAFEKEMQRVGQIITQSQGRLTTEMKDITDLKTGHMLFTFTAVSEQ